MSADSSAASAGSVSLIESATCLARNSLPRDSDEDAATATASAPHSAFGSRCVIRVEHRTSSRRRWGWRPKQTPMIGARMAGPLPADQTPLDFGEKRTRAAAFQGCLADAKRQPEQPPAQPLGQTEKKASGFAARIEQGLPGHAGVFGVIGKHAAPEQEMVALEVRIQQKYATRDSPSRGRPKPRVGHARQATGDRHLARGHGLQFLFNPKRETPKTGRRIPRSRW